jgi:hypothetical protein
MPATPQSYGIWQRGDRLIVVRSVRMPNLCVKCGVPVDGQPMRRTYAWHHPAFFLIILLNLIIYAIVALCVQKKCFVELYLCPVHRARRRNFIVGAWLLALASIALFISDAAQFQTGFIMAFSAVGFVAALIVGMLGSRILVPKLIDEHYAHFTGACPEFLAHFPAC